ncbi:RlpA-like double-psi beta-barrel-protein domain-containing protein-containing protein, partial [Mycena rebaudengoi]
LYLFICLLAATALAHSHNATLAAQRRGGGKKFSNYNAGLGACGSYNSDSEFVVAMSVQQWNNGANCGKEITITYNGKRTNAKIVDECMICPYDGLDFSQSLFSYFVGQGNNLEVGIIYGARLAYVGSSSGGDSTKTKTKTKTKNTPQPLKRSRPDPTTTTHTTTATHTTSTSKHTSAATTSSSVSASASASASAGSNVDSATGAIPAFAQALGNLAGLVVQGAGAT